MILRGASLSDSRMALEPIRSPRPVQPESAASRAPEPAVMERIVPAPITRESVTEWLKQDDARQWMTAYLADDLAALRAAACAEGFAAGEAAGLAKAQEQTSNATRALAAIAEQAEAAFDASIGELSDACAEIVCAAIAKVGGSLLSTREAALGAVLEVLKRVKHESELTIRVNAQDVQAVRDGVAEVERACAGRRFSIVADPRVQAGGCIVECSLGAFDGRFDIQLQGLAETLRAARVAPTQSAA